MTVCLQSVNQFKKKLDSINCLNEIHATGLMASELITSLRSVHSKKLFHEQMNALENLVFDCIEIKKIIQDEEKKLYAEAKKIDSNIDLIEKELQQNAQFFLVVQELELQALALLKNIFDVNTNKELLIKLRNNSQLQAYFRDNSLVLEQNFLPENPSQLKMLEDKYKKYDNQRRVTYLNEEQREAYRVLICGGVLKKLDRDYLKKNTDNRELKLIPFNTKSGINYGRDGDFQTIVVDDKGNMFAGRSIRNKFYHSSFLSGASAFFAGLVLTDSSGEILKITNESGHYKPEVKHTIGFLKWLGYRGALSEKMEVKIVGKGSSNDVNIVQIKSDQRDENSKLSKLTYTSWMTKSKVGVFNYRYTVLDQIDKLVLQYCKQYCAQVPQENINIINQILNLILIQQRTHPDSKRKEAVSELENQMKFDLSFWQEEQNKVNEEKVGYRNC